MAKKLTDSTKPAPTRGGRKPRVRAAADGAFPTLPIYETRMIRTIRASLMGLRSFLDPVYREFRLTDTTFNFLYFLASSPRGAASPTELSQLVGMSRANVTKVLDQLIREGLITREEDARDARRALIRPTVEGRRIAREATIQTIGPITEAFSGLTLEELKVLELLLHKLNARLPP